MSQELEDVERLFLDHAVSHFASQMESELGQEPPVKSIATLVRQVTHYVSVHIF